MSCVCSGGARCDFVGVLHAQRPLPLMKQPRMVNLLPSVWLAAYSKAD